MPQFSAPRGLNDMLPADAPYWRLVRDTAEQLANRYGYHPIDTPLFEEVGVFERGIGDGTDIVEKEMFLLQPRNEETRRFALRPEATAGLCRAYVEHGLSNLPAPQRVFWWGPNFRYERPQAGRLRQFHQIDLEAFGSDDPALDAEIILYAWDLYRTLGLRDLNVLVNSIGDRESRTPYLARLQDYFRPHFDRLPADDQVRFSKNPLRLLDSKNDMTRELLADAPDLHEALSPAAREHFAKVQAYLTAAGVPYTVEPRLVRGFDYYTHTVFEIVPPEAGSQGTIGGGGRYDGLIELLGGRPTPAVGFATGVERIILNLKKHGVTPPDLARPTAFVVHAGEGADVAALRLANELRAAGIATVLAAGGRSFRAQMRAADGSGAAYAVIIGADELAQGTATVRDLAAKEQEAVPLGEVAQRLGG